MWNKFRELWTTSIAFQAAVVISVIGVVVLATTTISAPTAPPVVPPPSPKFPTIPFPQLGGQPPPTGLMDEFGNTAGGLARAGGAAVRNVADTAVNGTEFVKEQSRALIPKP